jgi:NNP family nitrate/nitrite transporter-like MFS transporter
MQLKAFLKTGHPPTLFSAFLYFDVSFMVWILLGPLGIFIARDLGLSPSEKGLMVAIPVLSGAVFRFFMGLLVDRIGAKRTGLIGQVVVMAALAWAWIAQLDTLPQVYTLGVFLGVAGASFAVALPLASRWYPPESQGLAMGIAGAGNSGTVFTALFGPLLATRYGWNAVLGMVLIPLSLTFITYALLAKDSPDAPPPKTIRQYLAVLRDRDTWWFMFFYSVTFGGFVGISSSLVIYFNGQFGVNPIHAGYLTSACVLAGSLCRPIGGKLADSVGGIRSLQWVYGFVAVSAAGIALSSGSLVASMFCFVACMTALGIGNGSVFQIIPQRFRREIGVLTGLVGMAGGIGGFYLAASLGYSKQWTGGYNAGFFAFAVIGLVALFGLWSVKRRWRTTWGSPLVTSARL